VKAGDRFIAEGEQVWERKRVRFMGLDMEIGSIFSLPGIRLVGRDLAGVEFRLQPWQLHV
jgi:hypothetical protein